MLTTHIDKGHIHNHIIFCAASFIDYKKYNFNKKSYYAIREFSDKLCKEYELSALTPNHDTDRGTGRGKHYVEHAADKEGGGSWKSKLKTTIDNLIPQSSDFEDLLKRLEASGHEIKRGKYISVRATGQERFTHIKTLGVDYTEENVIKRIAGEYTPTAPSEKPRRQRKQDIEITFDAPEDIGANVGIFGVDTFATATPDIPAVNDTTAPITAAATDTTPEKTRIRSPCTRRQSDCRHRKLCKGTTKRGICPLAEAPKPKRSR